MRLPVRATITSMAALVIASSALATTLLEEKFPRRNRLQVIGFELTKPGEIEISAVGLGYPSADDLVAYAWILDRDTRHLVWEMKGEDTEKAWGKKYVRKITTERVFSRGKYELYLFTGNGDITYFSTGSNAIGLLDRIVSGSLRDPEDYLDDCSVKLSSSELSAADLVKFEPENNLPGALIAENRIGNDEYIEKGFKLDKAMNLRVYSFMEQLPGAEPVDFGWITRADTRAKVWSGSEERSVRGGGNRKNRKIDTEISLPAGSYVLHYVTDDSHSYRRFNAAPPSDPMNWGISLLPGKNADPAAFHVSDVPPEPTPLLDMTGVGDDENLSAEFSLARRTTLRIRAFGEQASLDDDFADYGWIEDANTGKNLWEMTSENTDHAGGADKNRMFDGEVTLPAGKYVVRYVTDGSHSYPDWNAGRPWFPRGWGLAIFPGAGMTNADFKLLSEPSERSKYRRGLRGELDLHDGW